MKTQGFNILQYLISFASVIILLYFAANMLKNKKCMFLKNLKNNLSIEERLFLGRDKEIIILRHENKKYIIGISGAGFQKIDSLDLKDGLHEKE